MVSCEQDFKVGEDVSFEKQSFKWRPDLLLNVVVVIYGQILL